MTPRREQLLCIFPFARCFRCVRTDVATPPNEQTKTNALRSDTAIATHAGLTFLSAEPIASWSIQSDAVRVLIQAE